VDAAHTERIESLFFWFSFILSDTFDDEMDGWDFYSKIFYIILYTRFSLFFRLLAVRLLW